MDNQKVFDLVADADELLAKLAKVEQPEIERLRQRVLAAVNDAKRALKRQARKSAESSAHAGDMIDDRADIRWLAACGALIIATVLLTLAVRK